jgi:biopolymer transport protein ExbD
MSMTSGRGPGAKFVDINVTPMADIMIVLLIILMVAVSVAGHGSVPLPIAANTADQNADKQSVILVRQDGSVAIKNHALNREQLRAQVRGYLAEVPGRSEIGLQADRNAAYSAVMEAMDACREAGAAEVALHTERKVGS